MSTRKLEGKSALITGASKGLGKAIALALAKAGARLALASRNLELLNETAAAVRKLGTEAAVFQVDVTDEAQVLRLEKAVAEEFGKVQILINSAGMNNRKPVTEFTLAEWRQVMDTNLTGVFLICRSFVPQMRGQGYGRISEPDLDHEPCRAAGPHGLRGEQGRFARLHARARARIGARARSPSTASAPGRSPPR